MPSESASACDRDYNFKKMYMDDHRKQDVPNSTQIVNRVLQNVNDATAIERARQLGTWRNILDQELIKWSGEKDINHKVINPSLIPHIPFNDFLDKYCQEKSTSDHEMKYRDFNHVPPLDRRVEYVSFELYIHEINVKV
jgi:hypothetical protein